MSERANARRSMCKNVSVGSQWTSRMYDSTTVYTVYRVECYGDVTFVHYYDSRDIDCILTDEGTVNQSVVHSCDALAFVNRFNLHTGLGVKERTTVRTTESVCVRYRNNGWTG
jgi:hypothetical protein